MKKSVALSLSVILLGLLCTVTVLSCGGKTPKTSKTSEILNVSCHVYEPTVSYQANGEVDSLSLVFSDSACAIESMGADVSDKVSISPAIAGSWKWDSDTVLRFQPREPWSLHQKYTITFASGLFRDSIKTPGSQSFTTANFVCIIQNSEFYINPENAQDKRATFTISASHPIDRTSLEKSISLQYALQTGKNTKENRSIGYTVTYTEHDTIAYVVTDNIPMPNYTSSVTLTTRDITSTMGGTATSKASKECTVPGMSDYVRINSVDFSLVKNDRNEYDQILAVSTKGQVSSNELLQHMKIYQLPKAKPAEQGWKKKNDVNWTRESESSFTDLVKSLSTQVVPEKIPGELEYATLSTFRISVPEDSYLAVVFDGTVEFYGGYRLSDEGVYYQYVKKYPKELGIVSEGALLALGGSQNIAMYSRGISEVEYTVSRIMPKDINHLVSMSNGDMKNLTFNNYRFNEKNISETSYYTYTVPGSGTDHLSYFSYNFSRNLYPDAEKHLSNGLFIFQVKDKNSNTKDRRFILVTDLGIILKKNENQSVDMFVQSVSKGTPVTGAKVRVIGLNGNTIAETTTDFQGHAWLLKLDSKETQRDGHKPVAYIIEKNDDLSFMPYDAYGRSVDYSSFDVGGVYDHVTPDKIDAYLFSDRGMYRPGETVHIGIIAKAGDWGKKLAGIPVDVTVKDSEGKDFYNSQFMLSSEGFEEVSFETRNWSPTGVYTVSFSLVKERDGKTYKEYLSGTTVKIEEFLPDTLNVASTFDPLPSSGWVGYDKAVSSLVKVKNLFGTPAAGNTVRATISVRSGLPDMRQFRSYQFHDPFARNSTYEQNLGDVFTDGEGSARFDIDLSRFERGSYAVDFYAEAFEKGGGRTVSTRNVLYISPLQYVIGYKADGRLDFITKNSTRTVRFIAVNNALESINLSDVVLKTEEITYVSTLVKQGNGLYKYQSVKKAVPVSEQIISIQKDGTDIVLPSDKPGEYKLTVYDASGDEYNSISYTIAGDANVSRSLNRTAELELNLETSDFEPGKTANVYIKAPYTGTGLITIEKDKVYAYKWFRQDSLSSVQTITIPKELEGNGYINVVFKRDYQSDEIFMSPFCYGAVPFSVSRAAKTQSITLNAPVEVKSGETLNITYAANTASKLILFGVDEGILQAARYQAPDPLSHFFKKRALQVATYQILDLILPEYNIIRRSMATGGGADMDMFARKLNPFKRHVDDSVVFWSGIVDASPVPATYSYTVPDYFNGSIRVFAVAVNDRAIGVEQTSVICTNSFVIQPSSPLAVAPGDTFNLPVSVTNLFKGSKGKVTLTAQSDDHLEIVGPKSFDLNLAEGEDSTVTFTVKALSSLGGAKITFTAAEKGGTEKSVITQTMSVRPNMPYQTRITSGTLSKQSQKVAVDVKTYAELANRAVYASVAPTAFRDGLQVYLTEYPYGCSEQITSQAYPYVFKSFVAGDKTKEECEQMVSDTIAILQSRQKSNGHIGYWTDKSPVDRFITLYVAEFLTDARKQGYTVPDSFYESVLDAVREVANERDDDLYNGIYLRSYATYILTKNEIITTNLIESIVNDAKDRKGSVDGYAGLYLAASYKMMKVDKEANAMLSKVNRTMFWSDSYRYHNSLQYASLYVTIVADYFPEKIQLLKKEMLADLFQFMTYAHYNSYSVSSALRALKALEDTAAQTGVTVSELQGTGKNQVTVPINLSNGLQGKGTFSEKADEILFEKQSDLPVYYMVLNGGYALENPVKKVNNSIEVFREYLNTDGSKITDLKKGDEVLVRISYRTTGTNPLYNIAIIDMQPACLEADIQSVRSSSGIRQMDYVDVREDRIVLYGNFSKDLQTFEYKARVINSGSFTVPPSYAESMYNPEIYSVAPSPALTVSD